MCYVLLTVLLAAAFPVLADESPTHQPRVSLELKGVTLRVAMEAVFRDSKSTYKLSEEAGKRIVHPIAFREVYLETALRALCRDTGLTYSSDNGVYSINVQPEPTQKSIEPAKEADQPTSPPRLFGMNRYELSQAVGKPDGVIYYQVPGREDWYYGDEIVAFVGCRVESFSRVEGTQLAVNMGRLPRRGKTGGEQTGSLLDPDQVFRHNLGVAKWYYGLTGGYDSISINMPSNAGLAGIPGDPNVLLARRGILPVSRVSFDVFGRPAVVSTSPVPLSRLLP